MVRRLEHAKTNVTRHVKNSHDDFVFSCVVASASAVVQVRTSVNQDSSGDHGKGPLWSTIQHFSPKPYCPKPYSDGIGRILNLHPKPLTLTGRNMDESCSDGQGTS